MLIFALISFSIIRGLHAIITKGAQKNYVNGFAEALYMTIIYALLQFIFLLVMPPYSMLNFETEMIFNPLLFAIFSTIGFVLYLTALRKGPTSLTNVINNFLMLVPIAAGLLLWNEVIKPFEVIGLMLVIVIMFLFNQNSYNEGEISKKITPEWIFLAIGGAFFSGIAVIFTKQHSLTYSYALKEYLILLNIFTFLLGLPYVIWAIKKKKIVLKFDIRFLMYVSAAAIIQNIGNIIYTFYAGKLNSVLFFPLMSILGIISVVIMSRLILKEKISVKAYIGIGLSFAAIYLLNL